MSADNSRDPSVESANSHCSLSNDNEPPPPFILESTSHSHCPSPSASCSPKPTNSTPQCHQEQLPRSSTLHGPVMARTTNPYPSKKPRTYSLSKRTLATLFVPPPTASSPPSTIMLTNLPNSFKRLSSKSWLSKTLWPSTMKRLAASKDNWGMLRYPLALSLTNGTSPAPSLQTIKALWSPDLSNN